MNKILTLYKKELNNLFSEIQEFSKKHPTLALGYNDLSENPHISRLVQAFSLLHTKLNIALEENNTEFITNLVEILYPHYVAPIPSLAIIALDVDKKQTLPVNVPKGKLLEMKSNKFISTFQICYDLQILPLQIRNAFCCGVTDKTSDNLAITSSTTKAILTIQLQASEEASLGDLGLNKIRFFIKSFNKLEYSIYQNLMSSVTAVIVNRIGDNAHPTLIDKNSIQPVGFSQQDVILPYHSSNSLEAYRLITEFFTFPQKFLFFDLSLDQVDLSLYSQNLEINFYLNNNQLEDLISKENFVLNAVPIINLFSLESDPISLEKGKAEYPVIIDNKNPDYYKIYQIEKVKIITEGVEKEGRPLFSYDVYGNNSDTFWYLTKRHNLLNNDLTKELYISLVNEDLLFLDEHTQYLYFQANCFNGNLPHDSYVKNSTDFRFIDNTVPVSDINCIIKPTSVAINNTNKDKEQKSALLAHLSLHYLNIINRGNAKTLFKEILAIYNFGNIKINELLIDSISNVKIQEEVTRVKIGKFYNFCRGNLIEIYFDISKLTEGLIYLFLNILDHFLAMYCSINSFTKLSGLTNDGTVLYQGLPRNGTKCLI